MYKTKQKFSKQVPNQIKRFWEAEQQFLNKPVFTYWCIGFCKISCHYTLLYPKNFVKRNFVRKHEKKI